MFERDLETTTHEQLYELMIEKISAQGPHKIYQAWDRLNVDGQRPVEQRFRVYRLADWITEQTTIIDLGCNVGFLSLKCAEHGAYVVGIERYSYWLEIAGLARRYLGIENAEFICGDALAYEPPNEFDLMLSLSFHHWGPETFAKYLERVYLAMLKVGGHLLFESHDLSRGKDPFEQYAELLVAAGFRIIQEGTCQCPTNYPRPNPRRKWVLMELMEK